MTAPVTRFAPSPTGMLHIGGARTALFNWLHARANRGSFLLRIEDTDRQRSTPEAVAAILQGLEWLGTDWDGACVYQHTRAERHAEVVEALLVAGHAYRCYATPDDIAAYKAEAGPHAIYTSPWRDGMRADRSDDRPLAVRLRIPDRAATVLDDAVYGTITWPHDAIEDLVILRTDGSPTYNLAAVVDDHDMAVSHVIRGDDHLANTPKQMLIYQALDWPLPRFAHLPLIHDEDGRKLSKRRGLAGLETYRNEGYLPESVRNYLTRLGWSHGDDEFYTTEQAIGWFSIEGIRKSPARLDHAKLDHLARRHLATTEPAALEAMMRAYRTAHPEVILAASHETRLLANLTTFQGRVPTLRALIEETRYLASGLSYAFDAHSREQLARTPAFILKAATASLEDVVWERNALADEIRTLAARLELAFGKVAGPLRAALTGRQASPGALDLMIILGREDVLDRCHHAADHLCTDNPAPADSQPG